MLAHLAVDYGEAERQIDHHMADAGGGERFRYAHPVEHYDCSPIPMMR